MSATALSNLFGSVGSSLFNNMNVEQQIDAQRYENQETRKYNLELAKQQNKWNIEQWNRENLYNSPQAQMARYRAAGLNPNLIYGQQNTSAQLSGSMSAGAPATPVDMSPMGRKKSVFGSVMDAIKNNPFLEEQLRGIQIDNDLKEQQLYRSELDSAFYDFMHNLDMDDKDIDTKLLGKLSVKERDTLLKLQKSRNETEYSRLETAFKSKTFDTLVEKVSQELKIQKDRAAADLKNITEQYVGIQADNRRKSAEADISEVNAEYAETDKIFSYVTQSAETLGLFIDLIAEIKGIAPSKLGKFKHMRKIDENTYSWQ